jgi:hypothetical protein
VGVGGNLGKFANLVLTLCFIHFYVEVSASVNRFNLEVGKPTFMLLCPAQPSSIAAGRPDAFVKQSPKV